VNVAFVLLTYNPDEPAGIERGLEALAAGLRANGHRAILIAAGPPDAADGPDLVRLSSLTLRRPMLFDDLPRLLTAPEAVCAEVGKLLGEHEIEVVCWADAVAGLGYLSPAPPGVRTVLMTYLARADRFMRTALGHDPEAVIAVSPFLVDEAAAAGLDTTSWYPLPNPLLHLHPRTAAVRREELRRHGAVRTLSRPDPGKGIAPMLRALPRDFGRPVEVVLASASFEMWPGMQDEVQRECRAIADGHPDIEILDPLPWDEAQRFLADAALTMSPATWPETFGNVPAEALSVGTPVVGFALGHLPALVGGAGRLVKPAQAGTVREITEVRRSSWDGSGANDDFDRLWAAAIDLLDDHDAYHAASARGPLQTAGHSPTAVADEFVRLLGGLS